MAPGSVMIRAEEHCLLEYKSDREGGLAMGLGWVSLHMNGSLQGKSLAISRNWPALGGAFYPQQDAHARTLRTQEVKI